MSSQAQGPPQPPYKEEVLGCMVEIQFQMPKGGFQFFQGQIRKMEVTLALDDQSKDVTHYVVFPDGDELWFDLMEYEQIGRLRWPNDNATDAAVATSTLSHNLSNGVADLLDNSDSEEEEETPSSAFARWKKAKRSSDTNSNSKPEKNEKSPTKPKPKSSPTPDAPPSSAQAIPASHSTPSRKRKETPPLVCQVHGIPVKRKKTARIEDKGRQFYLCGVEDKDERCDFFRWADDELEEHKTKKKATRQQEDEEWQPDAISNKRTKPQRQRKLQQRREEEDEFPAVVSQEIFVPSDDLSDSSHADYSSDASSQETTSSLESEDKKLAAVPSLQFPDPSDSTPLVHRRRQNLDSISCAATTNVNVITPDKPSSSRPKAPPVASPPTKNKNESTAETVAKMPDKTNPITADQPKRSSSTSSSSAAAHSKIVASAATVRTTSHAIDYIKSDEIQLNDFEYWLRNIHTGAKGKPLSRANWTCVMRQVKKLVAGQGIDYKNWATGIFFRRGTRFNLTDDYALLLEEAKLFETRHGKDLGNGWLLQHPIKKLHLYQIEYAPFIRERKREFLAFMGTTQRSESPSAVVSGVQDILKTIFTFVVRDKLERGGK